MVFMNVCFQLALCRKLPANSLNHTYKEVVADKLYLFQLEFSLQEAEVGRVASTELAAQFAL